MELFASASGVGERKDETSTASSKQVQGDSNMESRKDQAQVGSSKPTTHQVQDSRNGVNEGSSRMMEIEAETSATDLSKKADSAQVASTTSTESRNQENSAGPAIARHEPAHIAATDTQRQARNHQPHMSNIQAIALQPAGASRAGPSSQPGVANVNDVNLGLSLVIEILFSHSVW